MAHQELVGEPESAAERARRALGSSHHIDAWKDLATQPTRRRSLLLMSGVVGLAAIIVAGAWWAGRSTDTSATSRPATAGTAVTAPAGQASTTAGAPGGPTTAAAPDGTFTIPSTPDNPNGAPQYAVFTGGKVHLRGYYPSREIADFALSKAVAVIGPEYVVDEMQIDPAAPVDQSAFPVYFDDYILFEFGSAELAPDFLPILDLALIFLGQNPQAVITVVARTDAVGPEEVNLDLSRRRAESVIDYWLERGIDPSQAVPDPRGEEGASGGPEALDRRVEMVVSGLLTG